MIGAIFATDNNGAFGLNNRLPWKLEEDLNNFKRATYNSTIVMGKNTFFSLPKKLPNRKHVVITETPIDDVDTFSSIESAAESLVNNYWVIGGPSVLYGFKDVVDFHIVYHTVVFGDHEYDVGLDYHRIVENMTLFDSVVFEGFRVDRYLNHGKF